MIDSTSISYDWELPLSRVLEIGFFSLVARVSVTLSYRSIDDKGIDWNELYGISINFFRHKILTPYPQEEIQDHFPDFSSFRSALNLTSDQILGFGREPTNEALAKVIANRLFALAPKNVFQVDVTFWSSPDVGATATLTRSSHFLS